MRGLSSIFREFFARVGEILVLAGGARAGGSFYGV